MDLTPLQKKQISLVRNTTIINSIFIIALLIMFILYISQDENEESKNYIYTIIAGIIAGVSFTFYMALSFIVDPEYSQGLDIVISFFIFIIFLGIMSYSIERSELDDEQKRKGDLGINVTGIPVSIIILGLSFLRIMYPSW